MGLVYEIFEIKQTVMLALSGLGGVPHVTVLSTHFGMLGYWHQSSSSSVLKSTQVSPLMPPISCSLVPMYALPVTFQTPYSLQVSIVFPILVLGKQK